jgi:ubiquinone/menaquinone biosynthesis C-methylase UbiE
VSARLPTSDGYRGFDDVPARNGLQELVEVPALVRALRLPAGGCVLEIGCGRGIALPALHTLLRPAALIGLDVDGTLLALAAARAHGATASLVRADVRRIPLADASVDLVIDFGTCYHVANPDEALREVARVLRAGGLFVHETPVSQMLAHPVRSFGRRLPWRAVPALDARRTALLWSVREKRS